MVKVEEEFELLKDKIQAGSMMKTGLVVLWMISKRGMHGYEIVKVLNEDFMVKTATTSRIYPLLSKMTKMNLVKQEKIKNGKRVKKIYSITPKGKKMLELTKRYFKYLHNKKIVRDYMEWIMK